MTGKATQPYRPKPKEEAALDAWRQRAQKKAPSPALQLKASKDGTVQANPDHPDVGMGAALLSAALGTTDPYFLNGMIQQLVNVGTQGRTPQETPINFLLSVVKAVEPRDEIEAMLAAQMAAVHVATMTFARRLAHVDNVQQQDSAERAFNKLARTFTTQMDALKRYRSGGQQKMTVEHVHVHEGGQAIVGNVSAAGGGKK